MSIKDDIQKFIDGEVLDDKKTLKFYSRDASLFTVEPELVVLPKTSYDIRFLIHFVNSFNRSHDKKLSITPRAAGTDMTGGPLGESIILSFAKYMNHIREIGEDFGVVEPGAYYLDFEKAALKKGLLMPSYPASKAICAVGGMVGNNAGGEKTLSFGNTEKFVSELKVVLCDGNEYTFGPLNIEELEKKLSQDDFEGEIYRKIYDLLQRNPNLIKNAKPQVSKNSSGYFLWDIYDGKTFDLTKLFVGSQGTLGVITQIKFKLIRPKKHSKMLVIFLDSISSLGKLVNEVLEFKPESFEFYDDKTLEVAVKYIPEIIEYLKRNNHSHPGGELSPRFRAILENHKPRLTLLAEFTGDTNEEVERITRKVQGVIGNFNLESLVTRSKEEQQEYWAIRRESYNLLRHHSADMHASPFIEDIVVKPKHLPEFLPKLDKILNDYPIIFTIAGHIGDGHLHIIPLMDLNHQEIYKVIPELSRRVFELVFAFDGSIAGEHNDGLIRSPFVRGMYGERVYQLFKEVKKIFDPEGIFNPKKKVNLDLDYALDHIHF